MDKGKEFPTSPTEPGVDPEILAIFRRIQAGEMTPQQLAKLLDADGLVEGFLKINAFERKLGYYLNEGVEGILIAVDLDWFKQFNDSEGHPAGDDLLRLAGKILHQQTRTTLPEEEIQERRKNRPAQLDLLARAGDEFLVFMVGAEIDEAIKAVVRIRQSIVIATQEAFPNYDRIQTMSLGLSQTKPEDIVKTLRGRADQALYMAKEDRGSLGPQDGIVIN